MQLKVYAYKRKSVLVNGLDVENTEKQGYVSFFNNTNYRVIGFNTNYKENLFLLIFGLIALAAFITIATPLLINAHYDSIYMLASNRDKNSIFVMWGTAIICFIATTSIFIIDVYLLFVERLMMPKTPTRWIYYLSMTLTALFILFDLILAIFVKKKTDFPLPNLLQFIFCCENTVVPQTLVIWSGIVFMQLASFHMTFIFLAFVASPVQTGSTFLLIVTGILSGISLTTLFLAAFQKGVSTIAQKKRIFRSYFLKLLYFLLFIFILTFTLFFAICFIRITIYVGDVQSGGIPSLIATLAPSALLAGMGYLGKKVLENYVPRDNIEDTGNIDEASNNRDLFSETSNMSESPITNVELLAVTQPSGNTIDEQNLMV